MVDYWNHNVHYSRLLLDAVPQPCERALDIGCGDGLLAGKLANLCRDVTGIDLDVQMIELARAASPRANFIRGDFMGHEFEPQSFDFICANTSLHHMGSAAALLKAAKLVRPGGRLAVLGVARDRSWADYLVGSVAVPVNLIYKRRHTEGSSGWPVSGPDQSWAQARETARRLLPGATYRRLLLWRYLIIWDKPPD